MRKNYLLIHTTLQTVTAATKLKDAAPWKESYDKLSVLKSRVITLLTKVHTVKAMVFLQSCTDVRVGP